MKENLLSYLKITLSILVVVLVFTMMAMAPYNIVTEINKLREQNTMGGIQFGLTEVHSALSAESRTLEGTLTMGYASIISVFMNPVYQTEDGQIYLTEGQGLSLSGDHSMSASHTLSETNAYTINDETVEKSFTVKVNIVSKPKVEAYIVKQMNQQDELVKMTRITKNNIPEKIEKHQETEYFILEEHRKSSQQEATVSRSIIEGDEEQLTFYFIGENNIATPRYVEIVE